MGASENGADATLKGRGASCAIGAQSSKRTRKVEPARQSPAPPSQPHFSTSVPSHPSDHQKVAPVFFAIGREKTSGAAAKRRHF